MIFFHGGAPGLRLILPPIKTGAPSLADFGAGVCDPNKVYVTTSAAAQIFAAFHHSGRGTVYRVEPLGKLEPDPDCLEPGLSYQCDAARILRATRLSHERILAIREAVNPGQNLTTLLAGAGLGRLLAGELIAGEKMPGEAVK
jgi:rifampin ADP-ribosylating transferase